MDRRDALITGVVVGITCLLIAVVTFVAAADDEEITTTGPAGLSDADGLGATDPDDQPPADQLEAFVTEAIAFVEDARGRAFVERPEVLVLDEAAFTARIEQDLGAGLTEDPERLAELTAVYRALALIEPDDDLTEVVQAFGAAGVVGFYDPETDELVVRQRDELSLLTRSAIVHELTHAFDDQHFDLDRDEYDDRTDEIAWTFRAVAEGSASWVQARWEATLSADERAALLAEEFSFADPAILDRVTLAFLLYELSPYEYGEPFIEDRVEAAGPAGIDAVLTTPPVTSEQVIEPFRFDAGEPARALEPPPADGEVLIEGTGGEALIGSLFQGIGVSSDVEWGADHLVVWEEAGASCVRWDIRTDTVAGLAGLERGFERWADAVGGADVTRLGPETIRVDRCV